MLTMLQNWQGTVEINGNQYTGIKQAVADFKPGTEEIHIVLHPVTQTAVNEDGSHVKQGVIDTPMEHRITVKAYMTKKSSPEFDFMEKWNNDVPMPLRTMTGTVEKETRGMYYMKLHGVIWAEKICTCMCCGKKLTNPVSQYFGIGPECGGHNYVNPFDSDEELKEAVSTYRKKLQETTWEGWVIKSAIQKWEEV